MRKYARGYAGQPARVAFDFMIMMYGTLFMMAGAHTLSKNSHVRGDVLYGFFSPRTQATIDLTLYIVFFIPGVFALTYGGTTTPPSPGQSKSLRTSPPMARRTTPLRPSSQSPGAILLAQGIVEIVRCIICFSRAHGPRARLT